MGAGQKSKGGKVVTMIAAKVMDYTCFIWMVKVTMHIITIISCPSMRVKYVLVCRGSRDARRGSGCQHAAAEALGEEGYA